eukprot:6459476-Amphidinium_carterae.1
MEDIGRAVSGHTIIIPYEGGLYVYNVYGCKQGTNICMLPLAPLMSGAIGVLKLVGSHTGRITSSGEEETNCSESRLCSYVERGRGS